MTRFDYYRIPEAPPPRRSVRSVRSVLWAGLCISLELSILLWLWVVLNP
jgi:hypothetical protein